eukprot:GFKZ01004872.1.p1 GENE.GFKZ01004872.1~~GFKZ01004872.1.p1  ORF type:complete len:708 (+),score=73.84 GFKZ01004872.1:953-3076(+)
MTLESPIFLLLLLCLLPLPTFAASRFNRFRFRNIAENPNQSGLQFSRTPSHIYPLWRKRLENSLKRPFQEDEVPTFPEIMRGHVGIAVGDFNQDGYDDIYVTNGPGSANSLFINQYRRTNRLTFTDEAVSRGVDATDLDSSGVCYGDLNGDGRNDLILLSKISPNRLFIALANGRFREIDWVAATGDTQFLASTSCSVGDINNDGRLDFVISSGFSGQDFRACGFVPFDLNEPNQVFINQGPSETLPLTFAEETEESGINDLGGDIPPGADTITWAIALVDMNLDGNLDVVIANDQCALPTRAENPSMGANRGSIYVLYGNGYGTFRPRRLAPVNAEENNRRQGGEAWMGLSFGDFNCDGNMDLFGSNFGDYHQAEINLVSGRGGPPGLGFTSSRWWLGSSSGNFTDASVAETGVTVFGWGTVVMDYDNDGDQDIFMVGGLDNFVVAGSDNPNVIHENDGCRASFTYDLESWKPSGSLTNYNGLATGDFNLDGYPDIAAVSTFTTTAAQRTIAQQQYGDVLDETAFFTIQLNSSLVWSGNVLGDGKLLVDINSETDAETCWVSILPLGSLRLIPDGRVNRGALGATLFMKPDGLPRVMSPIIGGDSFASQSSPRRNFGLGPACRGMLEILWPGGVRNRLSVMHGEVLTVPEVPCSFDGEFATEEDYKLCLQRALRGLRAKGIITGGLQARLQAAGLRARRIFLRSGS